MFNKILVPVDGSDYSWKALEQAIEVAKEEGSTIHGLFVTDARLMEAPFLAAIPSDDPIPSSDSSLVQLTLEMSRRVNERGDKILARFAGHCQKSNVHATVERVEGVTSQVILERAKEVELVVMGRRGEGAPWAGPLLGSTFEAVVRHISVPVLAARSKTFSINRILIAFDGSDRAEDALKIAIHLAGEKKNRSIVFLTVDEGYAWLKQAYEKGESQFNEQSVKAKSLFVKGHAAEEIVRISQAENCDLIVIGGYGRRRFIEMLFGSTVDDVMRGAGCPVLICR